MVNRITSTPRLSDTRASSSRPFSRRTVLTAVAAGAVGALLRHQNLQGAQSLAPVSAEVLGSRFSPPSMRGTGGTQLIVRVAGLELPQQVLIDDPQAADWKPGQRLLLHWARGGSSGYFVTGWLALAAPLAESSSVQAGILLE